MDNLMDIGNKILKGINTRPDDGFHFLPFEYFKEFEEHEFDRFHHHHDDFHKHEKSRKDIELLNELNKKFEFILKKEYNIDKDDSIEEIHEIINHRLNPIIFDGVFHKGSLLNILFTDLEFLKNIKDPRFHEYFMMRRNLILLKRKIQKESIKPENYNYTITNLNKIMESIDKYILQYLFLLLILSNAENMILYTKKKKYNHDLRKRREKTPPPKSPV